MSKSCRLGLLGLVAIVGGACGDGPVSGSNLPLATQEPSFDATGTLVHQDDMDGYTTALLAGALPLGTLPRIVPLPSPVVTSEPVVTGTPGVDVISPGRDGAGKALRLKYSGATQDAPNWLTQNTQTLPNLTTHYWTYWARVTYASPLGSRTNAVKWFEAWHQSGNDRIQWNTHDHLPCQAPFSQPTYFQVYDQGRQTQCQGNQPVGPWFNQTIAVGNQWHRYTHEYRPNSKAGARDGVARMWIDGVKVIDISAAAIGVTPPGGEKPWCTVADVDALANNDGIKYVRWGSATTSSGPAWTMDVDDFIWWAKLP